MDTIPYDILCVVCKERIKNIPAKLRFKGEAYCEDCFIDIERSKRCEETVVHAT